MMSDLSRTAACYIVLITVCWVIVFYAWLRQREAMRKNKFRYDLRKIRIETEPGENNACRVCVYSGQHLLYSETADDAEQAADDAYRYKVFAAWAEEEQP